MIPENSMSAVRQGLQPLTFDFVDDGLVPNSKMPFLVYKRAVDVGNDHPEKTIEGLLGAARGNAIVRFGGDNGTELAIAAGDVAILPAGTGHQCLSSSADFSVVGAYPPGPPVEITRATPRNHERALKTIPNVKLPKTDPVLGADGPLVRLWNSSGVPSSRVPRA